MRVSIIVATYGEQHWADTAQARAVPSAETQNAHEVIVRHSPDGPLATIRNRAAAEATGDWLCFLDGDDELAPNYLKEIARVERHNRHRAGRRGMLLVPSAQYVYPDKETEPAIPNGGGTRPMLSINHIVIGAVVPRDLFRHVRGFDHRYEYIEDYELWCSCIAAGAVIIHAPRAVYRAYVHHDSRHRWSRLGAAQEHRRIRYKHWNVPALRDPVIK